MMTALAPFNCHWLLRLPRCHAVRTCTVKPRWRLRSSGCWRLFRGISTFATPPPREPKSSPSKKVSREYLVAVVIAVAVVYRGNTFWLWWLPAGGGTGEVLASDTVLG